MKHLLTFFACLFAVSLSAQIEFPYNPDSNSDDVIGTVDLLELLSLFGEEFSEEGLYLNTDSTQALYFTGDKNYFPCLEACSLLPGNWKMPSMAELGRMWSGVSGAAWIENSLESLKYYSQGSRYEPLRVKSNGEIDNYNPADPIGCYCYTHERPKVEYSYCEGGTFSSLTTCIDEKLAEGWYPLNNFPSNRDKQGFAGWTGSTTVVQYSPQSHASFWRWAE